MGHPSLPMLQRQVIGINNVLPFQCEASHLSKHHHVSFPSRPISRVFSPLELVHSTIWGPIHVASNTITIL